MYRYLGIDYGTKRIGLAISDEEAQFAFPEKILLNNNSTIDEIEKIIKQKNISAFVIGESLNLKGEQNAVYNDIVRFGDLLKSRFELPVYQEKEFMTSVFARSSTDQKKDFNKSQKHSRVEKKRSPKADASAAALILQRYLDRMNTK
ncbi:MAG: Holliday junction resolvase RuvX [Candidatus Pacebacteria bacterium]|nr:Holliday junction resolvase RuvX [Candidatus Paceibacterota bacterium]MCF7862446.1 Holliday junction resolvase RuvX [Candidatus Paceibacterota bacterium]